MTLKEIFAQTWAIIVEIVWPTRCAICDIPGEVLCKTCRRELSYIDRNLCCQRCGSIQGFLQCCECNSFVLNEEALFLDACYSVFSFEGASARLVTAYKDKHEIRLAPVLASLLSYQIDPLWKNSYTLVPIPSRKSSLQKRGFDTIGLIVEKLSEITALPFQNLLAQREVKDQRKLDARARMSNMRNSFTVIQGSTIPPNVILIDDIYTTGATLKSAAYALRAAGVQKIVGLTLGRVP